MKRILIILLILLLSGCSFQQQDYDDTYEFAKQAAIGYIETVLGYNAELRYELHRIESSEEYPIIYQTPEPRILPSSIGGQMNW